MMLPQVITTPEEFRDACMAMNRAQYDYMECTPESVARAKEARARELAEFELLQDLHEFAAIVRRRNPATVQKWLDELKALAREGSGR